MLEQDEEELEEQNVCCGYAAVYLPAPQQIYSSAQNPSAAGNESDLLDMRYCAHRAIDLLLQLEMKNIVWDIQVDMNYIR